MATLCVSKSGFDLEVAAARRCTLCAPFLPLGPRPVFRLTPAARVLIVGQAPGRRVHETGIPWNDPSGDRLREWLGMDRHRFYGDPGIGILPAGLCYPGRAPRGGDLPPRPECAPLWHPRLRPLLPRLRLTLLIGRHAQEYYLGKIARGRLSDTVAAWRSHGPAFFPLPHPSPRNRRWFRLHPWFESEVVPALRVAVGEALGTSFPDPAPAR